MCQMIRPACVVANFFASTGRETVKLRELRRVCESAEKTAVKHDCILDWSRHAVMAISDKYGNLFTLHDETVSKTSLFDAYMAAGYLDGEFNFNVPPEVISSLREALSKRPGLRKKRRLVAVS